MSTRFVVDAKRQKRQGLGTVHVLGLRVVTLLVFLCQGLRHTEGTYPSRPPTTRFTGVPTRSPTGSCLNWGCAEDTGCVAQGRCCCDLSCQSRGDCCGDFYQAGCNLTSPPMTSPTISPTTSAPTVSPTLGPTTSDPTLSPTVSPTGSCLNWGCSNDNSCVQLGHCCCDYACVDRGDCCSDYLDVGCNLTASPSPIPTMSPTTPFPSRLPTATPSATPSMTPSAFPSKPPSRLPTGIPSSVPTLTPTRNPTTRNPTESPSEGPTSNPTATPSQQPTDSPSLTPSEIPTSTPSQFPTAEPTSAPSEHPTSSPTREPSQHPSSIPSKAPTPAPSFAPSKDPTNLPSPSPSYAPSFSPLPLFGGGCTPYNKLDLVVIFDASKTGISHRNLINTIITRLLSLVSLGPSDTNTRISFVSYDRSPHIHLNFNEFNSIVTQNPEMSPADLVNQTLSNIAYTLDNSDPVPTDLAAIGRPLVKVTRDVLKVDNGYRKSKVLVLLIVAQASVETSEILARRRQALLDAGSVELYPVSIDQGRGRLPLTAVHDLADLTTTQPFNNYLRQDNVDDAVRDIATGILCDPDPVLRTTPNVNIYCDRTRGPISNFAATAGFKLKNFNQFSLDVLAPSGDFVQASSECARACFDVENSQCVAFELRLTRNGPICKLSSRNSSTSGIRKRSSSTVYDRLSSCTGAPYVVTSTPEPRRN